MRSLLWGHNYKVIHCEVYAFQWKNNLAPTENDRKVILQKKCIKLSFEINQLTKMLICYKRCPEKILHDMMYVINIPTGKILKIHNQKKQTYVTKIGAHAVKTHQIERSECFCETPSIKNRSTVFDLLTLVFSSYIPSFITVLHNKPCNRQWTVSYL